jgi:hypothetical protein
MSPRLGDRPERAPISLGGRRSAPYSQRGLGGSQGKRSVDVEFKQYDPGEPTGIRMSIHPDSVAAVECIIDNDQACEVALKSGGKYTRGR